MSPEEIISIQTEANRLVFEGRKVHVEVEELDRSQEKGVATLETGRSVGKALPDDYTGGVKRVVVIDGVDRNPYVTCHGTITSRLIYAHSVAVAPISLVSITCSCSSSLTQTHSLDQILHRLGSTFYQAQGSLII